MQCWLFPETNRIWQGWGELCILSGRSRLTPGFGGLPSDVPGYSVPPPSMLLMQHNFCSLVTLPALVNFCSMLPLAALVDFCSMLALPALANFCSLLSLATLVDFCSMLALPALTNFCSMLPLAALVDFYSMLALPALTNFCSLLPLAILVNFCPLNAWTITPLPGSHRRTVTQGGP